MSYYDEDGYGGRDDGYGSRQQQSTAYGSAPPPSDRPPVPPPTGGAWGGAVDEDPFAQAEKVTTDEASIFSKAEAYRGAAIDFDSYERPEAKVTGRSPPNPINSFEEADLDSHIAANVRRCKYSKPTPVQRYAIPIGLAKRDLMACAQTGSGKTAAFCFPIIHNILTSSENDDEIKLNMRKAYPRALILAPTRELASQIYEESRKFSYQTGLRPVVCYGGAPSGYQAQELEKGADIAIGTPGRLNMFLERAKVSFKSCKYLVLDEADRMLDMGFEPQIRQLVEESGMPRAGKRVTAMFSATFPPEIQRLAGDFMSDHLFLAIGRVGATTELIAQHFEQADGQKVKRELLLSIVSKVPGLTLVFVAKKRDADAIEDYLLENNFPAVTIHGDRTQEEREWALAQFRCGKRPIIVATDVASRGLDIPNVTHVINFDMPDNVDAYVHRIGRTGRAGKKGLATSFFSDRDMNLAGDLIDLLKEAKQEVPEFLESGGGGGGYGADSYGGGAYGGRDYRTGPGGGGFGRLENGHGDGGYERSDRADQSDPQQPVYNNAPEDANDCGW